MHTDLFVQVHGIVVWWTCTQVLRAEQCSGISGHHPPMLPSRLFRRTAARLLRSMPAGHAATTSGARQRLLLRRTLSTSSTSPASSTPADAVAPTVPEVTLSEITAAAYRIKDEVVS